LTVRPRPKSCNCGKLPKFIDRGVEMPRGTDQVAVESLPDLIENSAARYGIAPRKLWGWALNAIAKDELRPILPEGQSLDTEFSHGGMPLTLRRIIEARRVIEPGRDMERYDPSCEGWAKMLLFNPEQFDKWLRKVFRTKNIPVHPKRTAGAPKTKVETVALFIASYPDGTIPAGRTYKEVVRDIKQKFPRLSVSERTIRRALGRDWRHCLRAMSQFVIYQG
jgi:hypothetical protein